MTGYDRRQLARAERLLEQALREVRLARMRPDEDWVDVSLRCDWGAVRAGQAAVILQRAAHRIYRRRGES